MPEGGAGLGSPTDYGFAGEPQGDGPQAGGGLVQLRARWYRPAAGHLASRDPFAGLADAPQSYHPYAYAHNDPANRTDPTGMFAEGLIGDVLGALGVDPAEAVFKALQGVAGLAGGALCQASGGGTLILSVPTGMVASTAAAFANALRWVAPAAAMIVAGLEATGASASAAACAASVICAITVVVGALAIAIIIVEVTSPSPAVAAPPRPAQPAAPKSPPPASAQPSAQPSSAPQAQPSPGPGGGGDPVITDSDEDDDPYIYRDCDRRSAKCTVKNTALTREVDLITGLSFSEAQRTHPALRYSEEVLVGLGFSLDHDGGKPYKNLVGAPNPPQGTYGLGHVSAWVSDLGQWTDWYAEEQAFHGMPQNSQHSHRLFAAGEVVP